MTDEYPPTRIFYAPDYANGGFDTTMKSEFVLGSLLLDPVDGVEIVDPPRFPLGSLALGVHSPRYLEAVLTGQPRWLAQTSGLTWSEGHLRSVRASTSGADAAMAHSLRTRRHSGSLSSGMHHAGYDSGAGYCTVNGLGVMATSAMEKVLILDFDAHCGGGTFDILRDNPDVDCIDVAVDYYDGYNAQDRDGWSLTMVNDPDDYISTIEDLLTGLEGEDGTGPFDYSAVVYNAGMDPHENCEVGGRYGITTEMLAAREELVFKWAFCYDLPVAFVLAGGYVGRDMDIDELASLHRLTIEAAARWQPLGGR